MVNTIDRKYACAYKEVIEILKCISQNDVDKIPKDILNHFEENMDNDYEYIVKEEKDFQEQPMLDITEAILASFFRDYWATNEQKEKIIQYEEQERYIGRKELEEKYNTDNLFKNKQIEKIQQDTTSQIAMIEYKERNIFQKIFDKFIRIFKKK